MANAKSMRCISPRWSTGGLADIEKLVNRKVGNLSQVAVAHEKVALLGRIIVGGFIRESYVKFVCSK